MPDFYHQPYFRALGELKPDVPLFIYLPGMDSTGNLLSAQAGSLMQGFDIRCLTIPPDDLTGWDQLIEQIVALIRTELKHQPRPAVYLCGESFGGCLALKVITDAPDLFQALVLVNPASSFKRRNLLYWGSFAAQPLPKPLYQISCVGLLPFLAALDRITADDRRALLTAMQSVAPQSAIWRIGLLREFEISDQDLKRITQPALLVGSCNDRLLPSVSEVERLATQIPRAHVHILPDSGHACLLEADVHLYEIMQESGFLNWTAAELSVDVGQAQTGVSSH